ncbi:hypothetical protein H5410_048793 [Solanum commersonii]|uniref:Uncharacterized protein n=1 Tax=Solanum commersonii TaxID=4109 RepID=A0A9J5XLJ0_SOLCO|nr:hypothetical protein H5410_048793 [Solanum commersonii]
MVITFSSTKGGNKSAMSNMLINEPGLDWVFFFLPSQVIPLPRFSLFHTTKQHPTTPRSKKELRFIEVSSNVEIEAPSFNILTQTSSTNKNANPANKSVTPHKKKQSAVKEKEKEAKKIATPQNRKEQKRKGKMMDRT